MWYVCEKEMDHVYSSWSAIRMKRGSRLRSVQLTLKCTSRYLAAVLPEESIHGDDAIRNVSTEFSNGNRVACCYRQQLT